MAPTYDTPRQFHPDLTDERLRALAGVIAASRADTIATGYDASKGDNNWTLGCTGYRRICFAIERRARTPGFEWLGIIDPGQHFVFTIGALPMRFFRGEPDHPKPGTLACHLDELHALQAALFDTPVAQMPRLAYETDALGLVSSVTLVLFESDADDASPVETWPVALDGAARVTPIDQRKEPVDLPPLEIPPARPGRDASDADAGPDVRRSS